MNIEYKRSHFLNIFKHPLMGVTIISWFRILTLNRFKINWRFIPRTLFITLTAIFNIPFHFLEYLVYNRRIKRQEVREPVFIIGHPRSGTTYLFNLMAMDQQFGYCNTLQALLPNNYLFTGKLFRGLIKSALPKHRPQDNIELTIDAPKEEEFAISALYESSYLHAMYFPLSAKYHFNKSVLFKDAKDKRSWQKHFSFFVQKLSFSEKRRLLLKSPANLGRVEAILELYPDAKFIHIHRNPYDVYRSTVNLFEKIVPLTSFQIAVNNEMEDYAFYSYRSLHENYFKIVNDLDTSQLITVKYADLESSPLKTIEKIYAQLKINLDDMARTSIQHIIEKESNYKKNSYVPLSSYQRERINEEWAEIANKLDYQLSSKVSDNVTLNSST